jgi:hypothetical protein
MTNSTQRILEETVRYMRKNWPAILTAVILLFGVIVLPIWSSADFRYCVHHAGHYPSPNSSAAVGATSEKPTWIFGSCLNSFANENGSGITALATVLLTIATGLLAYLAFLQFRTSRAQLRAYVFVEFASIVDGPTWLNAPVPAQAGCPGSQLVIKNFGETPAYKVRHWSEIIIGPTATVDAQCVIPLDIGALPPTAIGPGGVTTMHRKYGRAITAFEIAGLATTGHSLMVFGKIVYEDAFGVEHITEYRLGYAGVYPVPPGTTLVFNAQGNSAT